MKILTNEQFFKLKMAMYNSAKLDVSKELGKYKLEYGKGYEEGLNVYKSLFDSVIDDLKKNFEKAKSSDEFCEWLYNSYLGGGKK